MNNFILHYIPKVLYSTYNTSLLVLSKCVIVYEYKGRGRQRVRGKGGKVVARVQRAEACMSGRIINTVYGQE